MKFFVNRNSYLLAVITPSAFSQGGRTLNELFTTAASDLPTPLYWEQEWCRTFPSPSRLDCCKDMSHQTGGYVIAQKTVGKTSQGSLWSAAHLNVSLGNLRISPTLCFYVTLQRIFIFARHRISYFSSCSNKMTWWNNWRGKRSIWLPVSEDIYIVRDAWEGMTPRSSWRWSVEDLHTACWWVRKLRYWMGQNLQWIKLPFSVLASDLFLWAQSEFWRLHSLLKQLYCLEIKHSNLWARMEHFICNIWFRR